MLSLSLSLFSCHSILTSHFSVAVDHHRGFTAAAAAAGPNASHYYSLIVAPPPSFLSPPPPFLCRHCPRYSFLSHKQLLCTLIFRIPRFFASSILLFCCCLLNLISNIFVGLLFFCRVRILSA